MASAKKEKQEVSPKAIGIVVAVLLILGGGNWIYEQVAGDNNQERAPQEETVEIEAPMDVTVLPYYSSDWMFEQHGKNVSVTTDLYMDDEGREFAKAVCNLTLYGSPDGTVENVSVEGQNGVEFCEDWRTRD
jgi:hypothetical protein